jgi:hypothetical protein
VRGKQNKSVEFGAKLSVSLDGDGFARVDHLRWDAFHEGLDLKSQVEARVILLLEPVGKLLFCYLRLNFQSSIVFCEKRMLTF